MRHFVVAEAGGVALDLLFDRTGAAQRHPVVAAVIGDERIIEGRLVEVVVGLPLFGRETVLEADLMILLPEVVILHAGIHTQFRRARRVLIVELHPPMQRQRVLDLERQRARARFGTWADDGINLAVAAGVGLVQLALENMGVEQHVRVQTRQRAQHVGRAEPAVARYIDGGERRLDDLDPNRRIGTAELLTRRRKHRHRHIAALAIGHLQIA